MYRPGFKEIGLGLFALALYAVIMNSMMGKEFLFLDEHRLIVNHWNVYISEAINPTYFFSGDVYLDRSSTFFRPILNTSFWLDVRAYGMDRPQEADFLKTNLLLHCLNLLLLFLLLRTLNTPLLPSTLISLGFALHPFVWMVVSWLPGRNDSLLMLFLLLGSLSFVGFQRTLTSTSGLSSKVVLYLTGHVMALFLALLTKELAILFLPVFLSIPMVFKHATVSKKGSWILLLPYAGITLAYFLLRCASDTPSVEQGSAVSDLLHFFPYQFTYLIQFLFPFRLSVYTIYADLIWWIYPIAAIVLGALLIWKSENTPVSIWMLSILLLSFGLFALGNQVILYHRFYIFIPFVLYCTYLSFPKNRSAQWVLAGVTALFIVTSVSFSKSLKNPEQFWLNSIKHSPSAGANYYELGYYYQLNGRPELAEANYRTAIANDSTIVDARNNLGVLYKSQGHFEKALTYYFEEIEVNPNPASVYENIGNVYSAQGKTEEAIRYYLKALELAPNMLKVAEKLMYSHLTLSRPEEAFVIYQQLKAAHYPIQDPRLVEYMESGNFQ